MRFAFRCALLRGKGRPNICNLAVSRWPRLVSPPPKSKRNPVSQAAWRRSGLMSAASYDGRVRGDRVFSPGIEAALLSAVVVIFFPPWFSGSALLLCPFLLFLGLLLHLSLRFKAAATAAAAASAAATISVDRSLWRARIVCGGCWIGSSEGRGAGTLSKRARCRESFSPFTPMEFALFSVACPI